MAQYTGDPRLRTDSHLCRLHNHIAVYDAVDHRTIRGNPEAAPDPAANRNGLTCKNGAAAQAGAF